MTKLAVALAAISALAISVQTSSGDAQKPLHETCKVASEMARSVMKTRLSGMPATEALDYYMTDGRPATIKLYQDFLVAAYERPAFTTESAKSQAITEFGDDVWVECMRRTGN